MKMRGFIILFQNNIKMINNYQFEGVVKNIGSILLNKAEQLNLGFGILKW
jgi:hypothetical protein